MGEQVLCLCCGKKRFLTKMVSLVLRHFIMHQNFWYFVSPNTIQKIRYSTQTDTQKIEIWRSSWQTQLSFRETNSTNRYRWQASIASCKSVTIPPISILHMMFTYLDLGDRNICILQFHWHKTSLPLTAFLTSTGAPFCTRNSTTARWPLRDAWCRGVLPSWVTDKGLRHGNHYDKQQ